MNRLQVGTSPEAPNELRNGQLRSKHKYMHTTHNTVRWRGGVLGLIAVLLLSAITVFSPVATDEAAAQSLGGSVSTVMVLDSSGSMTVNDAGERRKDAARAYLVSSLPDDEVSLVSFNDSATLLNGPTQVGPNRRSLQAGIELVSASGGTNLGRGLDAGCGALRSSNNGSRAAIFFTDGQGSYNGEVNCYQRSGWAVHTVGLGSGVDEGLLRDIAARSGGTYTQLASTDNLVCHFQQIRKLIGGLAAGDCTPTGSIRRGQTAVVEQTVNAGVAQFTFSATWAIGSTMSLSMTSPTGEVVNRNSIDPNVAVDYGATFETISISRPLSGTWRIEILATSTVQALEPFNFSTTEAFDGAPTISQAGTLTEVLAAQDYDPGRHANILRLYQAIFTREPDVSGARYWLGLAVSGQATYEQIIGSIATVNQPEYKQRYADVSSNREFVERIYLNVLGRPAEASGRDYWIRLMDSGVSGAEVIRWVSASEEFRLRFPYSKNAPPPAVPSPPAQIVSGVEPLSDVEIRNLRVDDLTPTTATIRFETTDCVGARYQLDNGGGVWQDGFPNEDECWTTLWAKLGRAPFNGTTSIRAGQTYTATVTTFGKGGQSDTERITFTIPTG